MNNEDNNLNTIDPQLNDNIVTITPVDNQNSNSNNDALTVDGSNQINDNLIPVNPIGDIVQSNNTQAQDNNVNNSSINQELSIVIPQMKNDSTNIDSSSSNTNSDLNVGSLQLNGSTPFDIGVSNSNSNNDVSNEQVVINSNNNSDSSNQDANIKNDINPPAVNINSNSELTVGFYIKNMILFSIPIVGLILMIKKATNKEDKNESVFAKAYLILYAIVFGFFIVLWIIFTIISVAFINSKTDNINYTTTIQEDYNG